MEVQEDEVEEVYVFVERLRLVNLESGWMMNGG